MTSDLLGRAAAELRVPSTWTTSCSLLKGITGAPDRHRQTGPGRVGAGGGVEHCLSPDAFRFLKSEVTQLGKDLTDFIKKRT